MRSVPACLAQLRMRVWPSWSRRYSLASPKPRAFGACAIAKDTGTAKSAVHRLFQNLAVRHARSFPGGHDENDLAYGRRWAMIGRLVGHFYITNATIRASFANADDLFNGLPVPDPARC